ncbi:MAG: serine/threonine-protein kinase [Myxococcales bacterium]
MGSADQPEQDPNLGRVLANQYGIDALLGHGGMGSVYRGRQLSIQRPVAIKLIAGAIASNEECIQRFRREAEAMALLHHPNTVRLFDFGVERGELFMVMELLAGEDLSEYLTQKGALPLQEALGILREVLQALSEAHARGIVHRDLKPANVFMTKVHGGQTFAKVMDFGIAGIEADSKTKLTLAGAVLGTPTYMSPEQAQGQPVDARSDLYSLGVMLFEMVTGSVPFAADSVVSLLLAQVSKVPPRLVQVRPELARNVSLQGLLDRLLAKSPDERPRDAAEVLALVDDVLREMTLGGAPGSYSATRVAKEQAPTAFAASAASADKRAVPAANSFPNTFTALFKQQGDKGPKILVVGALLLLAALGAVAALWPDGKDPTAPAPALAASAVEPEEQEAKPLPEAAPEAGRRARRETQAAEVGAGREARNDEATGGREARSDEATGAPADSTGVDESGGGSASTRTGSDNRPFPHLRNTFNRIFGSGGGGGGTAGSGASQSERRQALLARGPAYNNVAAAKRAYRAGNLSEQAYEDTIWVLKTRRARRIEAEKENLRAGVISKAEYKRRVTSIDREYEGS